MTKNVLVIPFEVIIGSQNIIEKAVRVLFYLAIVAVFFYLCLMTHLETSSPSRDAKFKTDEPKSVFLHLHPDKESLSSYTRNDGLSETHIVRPPNSIQINSTSIDNAKINNSAELLRISSAKLQALEKSPDPLFKTNNWVNETAPFHFPWPNETHCKDFLIKFAKNNTFRPRALVSFPGSGNSWLRYLIECSTGIFTGSLYVAKVVYQQGLYGEYRKADDGSTIVQKTHYDSIFSRNSSQIKGVAKYHMQLFQYKGILVIRNPFRSIFSYWNYLKTSNQINHVKALNTSSQVWINHVKYSAEKWASMITTWVENSEELLIVKYEELKKNPRAEVIGILHYLNVPIESKRLDCLMEKDNLEGPFHRETKIVNKTLKVVSPLSTSHILLPYIYASIYPSPLDTIIYDSIQEVNNLFVRNNIPIYLDYTIPGYYS